MEQNDQANRTGAPSASEAAGAGAAGEDAEPATATMEPGVLSPEEIEALRAQAGKAKEHWDQLLRATADLDNFKKRAIRERQEAIKFANESLMEKLIPVLDNLDMALTAAQAAGSNAAQSLQTGVAMVHQQLKSVLTEAGLEEIDASKKPFDPNWHEAVSQQETTEVPEGHVVQQLRKGYKLRERLVRPATVVVAKQPAS